MDPPDATQAPSDAASSPQAKERATATLTPVSGQTVAPLVPDYGLIRRIGGGAYGEVWLARSRATGVFRAAKIVWRRTFEDDRPFQREFEGIQRFERISREHPSQLALFHVGRNEAEGYFYYVMELADDAAAPLGENGGLKMEDGLKTGRVLSSPSSASFDPQCYTARTLRAELGHGRLSAERVLEIGLVLTEALGHLHNNGLVHRDVKPSNVIFVSGRPKLADIGLVTDASDRCSIVGTEGYLPSEGPGTPQADIFALGKVLYEAATGLDRREFPKLPEDLRSWPDAKPVFELNEVILKACAQDSDHRYKTCDEMLHELEHLGRGRSVKGRRMLHQRLRVIRQTGVAAVAIALAAAGTVFLWRMATGYNAPVVLGEEVLLSHKSEAIAAYKIGMPWLLRATPDGYRIALENFSRAVELDPKFVNAYARLFETCLLAEDRGVPGRLDKKKLNELATTLQKLAPTNADTHAAMAAVRFLNERRWNDAEIEFNQALTADPNCRMALTYYGYFLTRLQKPKEARKVLERAQNLYPTSVIVAKFLGHCEYARRHFEEALFLYAHAHNDLEPGYPSSHYWAGRALMAMTNYVAGLREFQKKDELQGDNANAVAYESYQKIVEDNPKDPARAFWAAMIEKQKPNYSNDLPYVVATRYALLPDKEQAFQWLNAALKQNDEIENLLFDNCWDLYRSEPRFQTIVKQVGLDPWQ